MAVFVDDAIKLAHMLFCNWNWVKIALGSLYSVLLFGLWSSLSRVTVTKFKGGCSYTSTKTSAVWLVMFSCITVTKSLKEAVATRHGMC